MDVDNRSPARRSCVASVLALAVALAGGCQPRGSGSDSAQAPETTPRETTSAPSSGVSDTAVTRADSVVLRTDKAQYRAGESMTLTLENRSGSRYAFNPCTRSIEREENGRWTTVPEPGRMCTMEAWILDPHGTRTGPTELPSPLAPGRYRVVVRMTRESGGGAAGAEAVAAVSEPIEVR